MNGARIVAAGDAALVAEFEERIDPAVNARVVALADALRALELPGVRDVVPTFRSVTVYFDPLVADVAGLADAMRELARTGAAAHARESRTVDVPVCYDAVYGLDLDDVARGAGMTAAEVIELHTAATCRVFMLGFVPGFAYLGPIDPRIATPRLAAPRTRVPAGSVGIAGAQTGIYPLATPGGWNLVGRTPLRMLDLTRDTPARLRPGDRVRFRAIDRAEFERLTDAAWTS